MSIQLIVRSLYFDSIATGVKVVEGRLFKPLLHHLKINDMICIKEDSSSAYLREMAVKVLYLSRYPTFRAMLEKEGLSRCLPGVKTIEEGVNIYYSFPSYKQDEKLYGVLAIGLCAPQLKTTEVDKKAP